MADFYGRRGAPGAPTKSRPGGGAPGAFGGANGGGDARSGEVCKYFLAGNCKFGDACKNVHPRGKQGGQGHAQPAPRVPGGVGGDGRSGQVCEFFLKGNCKFGDRCKYVHLRGQAGTMAHTGPVAAPMFDPRGSTATHGRPFHGAMGAMGAPVTHTSMPTNIFAPAAASVAPQAFHVLGAAHGMAAHVHTHAHTMVAPTVAYTGMYGAAAPVSAATAASWPVMQRDESMHDDWDSSVPAGTHTHTHHTGFAPPTAAAAQLHGMYTHAGMSKAGVATSSWLGAAPAAPGKVANIFAPRSSPGMGLHHGVGGTETLLGVATGIGGSAVTGMGADVSMTSLDGSNAGITHVSAGSRNLGTTSTSNTGASPSAAAIALYQADTFQLGRIPEVPPPRELCA